MSIKEKIVNFTIHYGAIIVLACAVANVYLVMRYVELYRAVVKAETQFQQVDLQRRAFEGVLREFAQRANSDTAIFQILQRGQAAQSQPAQK